MTVTGSEPPATAINTGSNHCYDRTFYEGEWVGIHEWHRRKSDGEWCVGWIPFTGSSIATGDTWDVVQRDPLTLSPSLLCTSCGSHGFIRDGRWEEC